MRIEYQTVQSDVGLHCLLTPACLKVYGQQSILYVIKCLMNAKSVKVLSSLITQGIEAKSKTNFGFEVKQKRFSLLHIY